MSRSGTFLVASLMVAATAACGCSGEFDYGKTCKVVGRLTMDGKPLSTGTGVSFMEPINGYLAYGVTDAEGNFEVKSWNNGRMPLGKYKVSLTPPPAQGPAPAAMTPEQKFDHPELAEPVLRLEYPKKYADMKTSGLEFEVKDSENHFEINIEKGKASSKS